MQTSIIQELLHTPDGQEADRILRACTHCGFCTATCPTYQLLGDERDGPRGRIYLIKQVLEGHQPTRKTQIHLDRCLTCRACETTCPADVAYARLADIGRNLVAQQVPRPWPQRLLRWGLRSLVGHRRRFALLMFCGRLLRPLLPARLESTIPRRQRAGAWPQATAHARTMLALAGCVQPATTPQTNAAAARVLAKLDIALIEVPNAGCCGALPQHLSAPEQARACARRNINAWWPYIENGAEALVMTASGCGAQVLEYGHLLRDEPAYAAKAKRVSEITRDLSEILAGELADKQVPAVDGRDAARTIAYHPPCTLQNAAGLNDHVAPILRRAGYRLVPVADRHLCCGSAGTYSILEPQLANRLRRDKLDNLEEHGPEAIVTANVGCQLHLAAAADVPVRHWIELLDPDPPGEDPMH